MFSDLFHPAHGNHVSGPPSQDTVDESGQADEAPAGFVGRGNNGKPSVAQLPHPQQREIAEGMEPMQFDMLDILDKLYVLVAEQNHAMRKRSLDEDESIKRRMRGPLRASADFTTDELSGLPVATITFGPVPSGEIWLVDRYVVSTNNLVNAATTPGTYINLCNVFAGAIDDYSSLVDTTVKGDGDVSDNTQPVIMFPNSFLTFQWTVLHADTFSVTAYARVTYRSIAENVQFAEGNQGVI